jgi:hypothetical protein
MEGLGPSTKPVDAKRNGSEGWIVAFFVSFLSCADNNDDFMEWATLHEVYDMILQQNNDTAAPLQSCFIKRLSYAV